MRTNQKPNRLIAEKSPYLLQHAHNPVNWYPWGNEAFEKAKRENKPVLVSIGYSTCHWCHVMAHESFEDEEVAKILNEKFVSIKVDREERPDVDSIYMNVCQMLTGHGGWPLNVFVTPDQKPFYAGTYFPKARKYGQPGFGEVLNKICQIYQEDSNKIIEITTRILDALKYKPTEENEVVLSKETIHDLFESLQENFDPVNGGFGQAPKFPMPHNLMYLMRYHYLTKETFALEMVEKTLHAMYIGGIYDHVGHGFSRYSTDDRWLVPHFEKMLYDNALLLAAYSEAYQITRKEAYKDVASQLIEFVKSEMTSQDGGFYSAIDADSEGVEGKYYVWAKDEILNVLGDELGDLYCEAYDITKRGNFEGHNIPNLIRTNFELLAAEKGLGTEQLLKKLEHARHVLEKARRKRVYPHLDDKILTSWNALMVASLAKASRALQNGEYLNLAVNAIKFIEENLIVEGRVMARFRIGEAGIKGFIDDYAFLLWAYVELYESSYDLSFLKKAKGLFAEMVRLFWDKENGGFYFYGEDAENLIVREKESYDGAIPSGNGVAIVALQKLFHYTADVKIGECVDKMLSAFKKEIEQYPPGHSFFLQSLLFYDNKKEVVVLGPKDDMERNHFISTVHQKFLPNINILVGENPTDFKEIADFAVDYKLINNKTTFYVCENFSCNQPTNSAKEALKLVLS